ncbi:MAG: helix-turn-helix domain-containing protein [Thermoanaerobaculia bacterium]
MTPAQGSPHRQPPWSPSGEGDAVSFGNWLRRERELRQVSLREISDETKISIRYLEALEEDRFDILPGTVFAKGFLRQYARYVGLDGDEVVNSYLSAQSGYRAEDATGGVRRKRRRGEWLTGTLLASGLLVLLAAVAALAFYAERSTEEPETSPSPVVAPPRPVTPAGPMPQQVEEESAGAGVTATLDFDGECWVEAVVDGRRAVSELRVQGESLTLEGDRTIELTLDAPDVVRMEVDGEAFDLSGRAAGEPILLESPQPAEASEAEPTPEPAP